MKKFMWMLLFLAGCQSNSFLTGGLSDEGGNSAVETESVTSGGGLNTYGSGSNSNSSEGSNTLGGGNSGEIESPGGGAGGGASSDGGMDVEEP